MSEFTKSKASARKWTGVDSRWTILLNGAVRFHTAGDNDEANAKELIRRWNAFEDDFNARLVAATSDLLQVCQDIVAFDKNDQFDNNYLVHILVKKAKTAIAKCS